MIRLNNKDYTEEQLEQLLKKVELGVKLGDIKDNFIEEMVDGMKYEKEGKQVYPIGWDFKFSVLFAPRDIEQAKIIKQAMRSPTINEALREKFSQMVRFEINAYIIALQMKCVIDEGV